MVRTQLLVAGLLAFLALRLFVDYFDFNVDLWFLLHAISSIVLVPGDRVKYVE